MILRQYLQTEPVVAVSYLFGCGGKGSDDIPACPARAGQIRAENCGAATVGA